MNEAKPFERRSFERRGGGPGRKPGLAFALGGGVARGWAHIGVMKAIDERDLPVRMVAGTSIGALVGGCYMAGKLDELETFALSLTRRRLLGFLDISLRGSGLITGIKLAERMEDHLDDILIENIPGSLVCVAAEITTGHEIWLSSGSLIDAIRASYALPGIFEPIELDGRVLVDGAIVNPVPVSPCRAYECPVVIAVNLASEQYGRGAVVRTTRPRNVGTALDATKGQLAVPAKTIWRSLFGERGSTIGITGVMMEAFNIIQDRITRSRLAGDPPDLTLSPDVQAIGLADFHRAEECIEIGYNATMAQMEKLEAAAEASLRV